MNFQLLETSSLSENSTASPVGDSTPSRKSPFLPFVAIVAILAAIYYGAIAAPMYVTETRFGIRSQLPSATPGLLAVLNGASDMTADVISVQDYIQSQDMLNALDQQFKLRDAYSKSRVDLLHWLPPWSGDEAFLDFYRRMVLLKIDRDSGIVEVDVRTFDKASGPLVANAILVKTEAFVDGMTARLRTESLRTAQTELDRARRQAEVARKAVASFRGASSSVNPSNGGANMQGGQAALDAQAAGIQADLASALTFNQADSPVVSQLRARLAATKAQSDRLRAQQGAGGASGQVTTYETIVAQRDDAEQRLVNAQTAFDGARLVAEAKEKYVVRVVAPGQPDRPSEPKRVLDFLMVLLFALTGYSIVSLAIAGIRDHRGV